MKFRAEIEGFQGHFNTVAELKAWALGLDARHNLKGKVCNIWQATWVARDGSGASYNARPTRSVVVGA